MQNLLSEYRTIKNIVMGVRNRGSFPLKYPHSIDKDLLALYAQGLTIPEISRKVGIPYETIRRRLKQNGAKPASPRFIARYGEIRYCGHCRHWSEDEKRKFIELFPFHTNKEIAEIFCCKVKTVKNKAISLGLKKDAVWLHEYRLSSMKIATTISKSSSKKFRFEKGNTIGYRFRKGFKYDKEFWEKYRRGEVALP